MFRELLNHSVISHTKQAKSHVNSHNQVRTLIEWQANLLPPTCPLKMNMTPSCARGHQTDTPQRARLPPLYHRNSRCLHSTLTVSHNSCFLKAKTSLRFGYHGGKKRQRAVPHHFLRPGEVNKNINVYCQLSWKMKSPPRVEMNEAFQSVDSGDNRPWSWALQALPNSQFFLEKSTWGWERGPQSSHDWVPPRRQGAPLQSWKLKEGKKKQSELQMPHHGNRC